jgi:hypothetical protein
MRFPQITDRMKEAPTHVLRAVFAGIGQALLVADKIKSQVQEQARAQRAGPEPTKTAAARPVPAKPVPAKPVVAEPVVTEAVVTEPEVTEAVVVEAAAAEPAAAAASLPLADYDDLSMPALRARMRGLDIPQLRVLVDYENANAARETVVAMFERRIAKLGSGQD